MKGEQAYTTLSSSASSWEVMLSLAVAVAPFAVIALVLFLYDVFDGFDGTHDA